MGKKLILAQTFNPVFSLLSYFSLPLLNIAVSKFFRNTQTEKSSAYFGGVGWVGDEMRILK